MIKKNLSVGIIGLMFQPIKLHNRACVQECGLAPPPQGSHEFVALIEVHNAIDVLHDVSRVECA